MHNLTIKRVIALVVLLTAVCAAGFGRTDNPPTPQEEEAARKTADLFQNEIFSALITEFNETTPENADLGKQAISLIFHNANRDMRLIGIFPPLQGGLNNLPSDSFERKSMVKALQGTENTSVERVGDRWYYRRSIPLSNAAHPSCVMCHSNFTPEFFTQTHNPDQWVGALVLRVPIKED